MAGLRSDGRKWSESRNNRSHCRSSSWKHSTKRKYSLFCWSHHQGSVLAKVPASWISAHWSWLARGDVWEEPERNLSRRDGSRQDHSDHLADCSSCLWKGHLGTSSNRRANECHAQLGNGTKEVVSGTENSHLLRQSKGATHQAKGLDKAKHLPRLHHLLQTCRPRSRILSPQKVGLFHSRRSSTYKKLQVSTMANAA